jgi:type II pantothenate kinase
MAGALPLLRAPDVYRRCDFPLDDDPVRRRYWLTLFRDHFPRVLAAAMDDAIAGDSAQAEAEVRAAAARAEFEQFLDELAGRLGDGLDIYALCVARERSLRRHGFVDAFRQVKAEETETALALLPDLLVQLDALDDEQRLRELMRGIFAGNIFDLGATHTAHLFDEAGIDFRATLERLPPRPWLVDDLEPFSARLAEGRRYRTALLFVDNAGPDLVLGMLPFARELLARGTDVILSANSGAALNDVTHAELVEIVVRVASWDTQYRRALATGRLELVASGNEAPLIDLSSVASELAEAVDRRGVDLVMLEGMGRAVESNFHAEFRCDCLKIAMLKDPDVASWLGGKVYDLVLKFERR